MKQRWGTQSNWQEKIFYSLVNIPRVYFAKHLTKRSEYREEYKHAIVVYNIEQRFFDYNICITLTKSSIDIKIR